jgi:hypothetical protein
MNSTTIKKYSKYSVPDLIKKATIKFNKFIRERDNGLPCISCGTHTELQAGHFYSGGHYSCLKFNENNVHGQCKRCNYFLSGNLNEYRKNLVKRIGQPGIDELDRIAALYKRNGFKWDRFSIIEIIENI